MKYVHIFCSIPRASHTNRLKVYYWSTISNYIKDLCYIVHMCRADYYKCFAIKQLKYLNKYNDTHKRFSR